VLMRVLALVSGSASTSRLLAKDIYISITSKGRIVRLAFALELFTRTVPDLFSWVRTSGVTAGPAEGKGKKKDMASSLGELRRRGQWRVCLESKVMRRARRVNAPVRSVVRKKVGGGWQKTHKESSIGRQYMRAPEKNGPTDKRIACRPYIDFRDHGPSISWLMFGIFLGKREQAPTTGFWLVKALSSGL
jgi:hypothetical protein